MIETISIRVAHWAFEEVLFKGTTFDTLIRDLLNIINSAPYVLQVTHRWIPPLGFDLKLNFDGCSLGSIMDASLS